MTPAGGPGFDPAAFAELQRRLLPLWRSLERERHGPHTSVVVPSLSFDVEEMSKVQGVSFYEERLLFALIRLRDPGTTVIYVTSQPLHPEIIDYYLRLLRGVSLSSARSRLHLVSLYDSSPVPLSRKLLDRPRTLRRLRRLIPDRRRAYLTCFNVTDLECRLALEIGVPVNGVEPSLLWTGTKSGSRKIFRDAGVDQADGFEDLRTRDQLVDALGELRARDPGLRRAVVKLNESFAGAGNAVFAYPAAGANDRAALDAALEDLAWTSASESLERFLRKLGEMGGIAEAFLEGERLRSPSAQLRVNPDATVNLISTHDQVLGGPTGQTYLGCRFPADDAYRDLIQERGLKIGEVLRDQGVIGRFGIDFLVRPEANGWRAFAVEINLRMGGTTPPFMALQFLTGGAIDVDSGRFTSRRGVAKYYYATDNLRSPLYKGLVTEDFTEILAARDLDFDPTTETGSVFHMIGALSEFGKLGVTCIGDSPAEAEEIYAHVVAVLDSEGADGEPDSEPRHPFDIAATGMM